MTESNKRLKTKRNIEEAMVRLLEKESFDQITTVELAQESGISRSSFYTHYRDKYDMIERYQQALFHKLEYIFDKHQPSYDINCRFFWLIVCKSAIVINH